MYVGNQNKESRGGSNLLHIITAHLQDIALGDTGDLTIIVKPQVCFLY